MIFTCTHRANSLMLTAISLGCLYIAMSVQGDVVMQSIFVLNALAFAVFPIIDLFKWVMR